MKIKDIKPRLWQGRFLQDFIVHKGRTYTLVATPRAGKTFASIMAFILGRGERFDRILVIGPTDEVRSQWMVSAAKLNIQLARFKSFRERIQEFDGISMTYHQLINHAGGLDRFCRAHRVFVVLDEPHHLADQKSWGLAAENALYHAAKILLITGTPWRSDTFKIPFMEYDALGRNRWNLSYSYGQAVIDNVVRPIRFSIQGGSVRWQYKIEKDDSTDVREYKFDFKDEIDSILSNQRLRAALDPDQDFMQQMIKNAHRRLMLLRRKQSNAGCLTVCYDIEHAKKMMHAVWKITGTKPLLVTSDNNDSRSAIAAFRFGTTPHLVSVQMISEGVDIPRLRVLLFATVIKTSMHFRQITARPLTLDPRYPGESFCFLPADPVLVSHAREMEKELRHAIEQKGVGQQKALFDDDETSQDDALRYIETIQAQAAPAQDVAGYDDGGQISRSLAEKKEGIRQEIQRVVCDIARLENSTPRAIHRKWLEFGPAHKDADLEQLQTKLHWAVSLRNKLTMRGFYQPRKSIFSE